MNNLYAEIFVERSLHCHLFQLILVPIQSTSKGMERIVLNSSGIASGIVVLNLQAHE